MAGTRQSIPKEEPFVGRLAYQDYQRTVRLILTECDSVPDLPLTLTLKAPVVAELLTVNVNVLPDVEEFGLKVAVTPVGRLDAEKLTVPVKPRIGLTVIVDVPVLPRATLRLLGDAERLKFGPGFTVRAIVVVCVRPPDVPVIVTLKFPVDAVPLAVSVSVLVLVVLLGLNDGVTPLGRPEADRLTLPLKPLCGLTVIVLVPLAPWVIVMLEGDAERLKFCWPAAFTVRLTVVVCVKPGDVPVIVTVNVPVVAPLLAVSVSVLAPVVLLGLSVAVTPLGWPEADRLTLPVKPF